MDEWFARVNDLKISFYVAELRMFFTFYQTPDLLSHLLLYSSFHLFNMFWILRSKRSILVNAFI